jgi:chromosome segregation ATPase
MAVSIGGILFSVGMNTSGFEAGAKKVADLEAKMKNQVQQSLLAQSQETRKLNKLRNQMEKAKADYMKKNQLLTETSTKEERKAVDKLLQSYKKLEKAYESADEKLRDKIQTNKLNIHQMQEEINEAKKLSAISTADVLKSTRNMIGNVAGFMSVGAIKAFIDKLDALGKRARDIGMTSSQLQEFQHQANLAGISTGALDSSIKAFNRNIGLASIGTGEAKTALESMGISLTKANGTAKTQSELLKETAMYFSKNAGSAENAGYSARIFGESGVELLRVFEQGKDVIDGVFNAQGIDKATEAAERFNDALENAQNFGIKVGASAVEGWSYILDLFRGDLIHGIGYAELERQTEKLNEETAKKIKAQEQARLKAMEELRKKEIAEEEKIANIRMELEEAEKQYNREKLSDIDKQLNLQNEINNLTKEIVELEEKGIIDDKYKKLYLERIKLLKEVESIEKSIANAESQKIDKQQKKFEADKKKAENEAKKLAEKQQSILLARQEFELQFKISKLEKGSAKEQAEAQAIKNSIKRNELMQKYGYDIKTATQALKAMRDLENQGKYKYSDKDVAKAKRIVERSQSGKNVGKKTLAQAQAILSGSALSSDRVAMFSDVKALQQGEMQFANIPAGSTSPVVIGAGATATPTLSATPVANQQANTNNIFQQILDAINGIPDLLGNQLKEVFSE